MAEGEQGSNPLLPRPTPLEGLTKPEIHRFTKSTEEGRQARRETVLKVLEKRHARSEHQRAMTNVSTQIGETTQSVEVVEQKKVDEEQRVLYLRAELNQRANSFLAKVREFVSSGAREERANMETELNQTVENIPWTKNAVRELQLKVGGLEFQLDHLKSIQSTFPSGREELNRFYAEQSQKLILHRINEERQRELAELEKYKLENGTIQKAAEQFDSYIVHGFNLTRGGLNSIMRLNSDWRAKLDVCVALIPAIAASSIRRGKPEPNLWSPLGIVMGEGVISNASHTDTASVAESIHKRRSTNVEAGTIAEYRHRFSLALSKSMNGAYPNELDLEFGSRPSAIFINLDFGGSSAPGEKSIKVNNNKHIKYQDDKAEITYDQIFEAAEFVGLSVVCFKDGIAYEAKLNKKTKKLVLGREILPVEITSMKPEVPAANFPEVEARAKAQLSPMALI